MVHAVSLWSSSRRVLRLDDTPMTGVDRSRDGDLQETPPLDGQMMQGGGMMGDMSGMQNMMGMMQMMQRMGPMMEACTEMMQHMAHHSPEHDMPPAGTDADPAPQGG